MSVEYLSYLTCLLIFLNYISPNSYWRDTSFVKKIFLCMSKRDYKHFFSLILFAESSLEGLFREPFSLQQSVWNIFFFPCNSRIETKGHIFTAKQIFLCLLLLNFPFSHSKDITQIDMKCNSSLSNIYELLGNGSCVLQMWDVQGTVSIWSTQKWPHYAGMKA